ncbi:Thiol-specific monooxygenase [Taphrina deformans PYCC 5710]|uniref:Thiol-specific monooxygenase n=1 Tax=Taphrina deformans (strain PYCC 5710 / ATCC 11124 / CBS 356.35 / IMI 108563 / JCM 9778 / NBRC 8474) TaxID=1097556 RepID=R4X7F4_TAPDE|nr:Thiol-specific monooxygenase [Taphrina deformans PYCC 5710]|eukprot:CCG81284.1 Thiol-specific monooxygenase [Taphrina deformans PYCC 5710]
MLAATDPILIVGAGASGLVSAKAFLSEGFTDVTIFERREDVGGVWLFDDDRPAEGGRGAQRFPSPMYDRLVGNIWYRLLELESHKFPAGAPEFPTRQMMQDYLLEYAEDLRPSIRLCTNVKTVYKDGQDWVVNSTETVPPFKCSEQRFRAVILSCGIYDTPDQPDIPGLQEMKERYPDMVFHSKFYRNPQVFEGQKLLIMGNGPSGIDIAAQTADFARLPIIRTIHGPPEHACLPDKRIEDLPAVAHFDADSRSAHLIDGQVVPDLDRIIISTGYRHSYPFLQRLNESENALVTDGARVHNLYRHIFYRPDPTLCFIGLLIAAIPFPISEAQALTAARVLSGRLSLPSDAEMRRDEEERLEAVGNTYKFHKMRYPLDADYGDKLRDWCLEAKPRKEVEKLPVAWTEERRAWRRMNLEMKMESLRQARDQNAITGSIP